MDMDIKGSTVTKHRYRRRQTHEARERHSYRKCRYNTVAYNGKRPDMWRSNVLQIGKYTAKQLWSSNPNPVLVFSRG